MFTLIYLCSIPIITIVVASLVRWLLNHMPAIWWKVLVRTGFESCWVRISVAVPMVYLAMLNLWPAYCGMKWTDTTYHWHAVTDMSATGWSNDCIQFKLSHKPWVAIINATLLFLLLQPASMQYVCCHASGDYWLVSIRININLIMCQDRKSNINFHTFSYQEKLAHSSCGLYIILMLQIVTLLTWLWCTSKWK